MNVIFVLCKSCENPDPNKYITADAGAQNNHWIDIAPRKTSTLANLIAVVHWYWPNIPSHCCRKWQFPGSKRMLSRTTINQANNQTTNNQTKKQAEVVAARL